MQCTCRYAGTPGMPVSIPNSAQCITNLPKRPLSTAVDATSAPVHLNSKSASSVDNCHHCLSMLECRVVSAFRCFHRTQQQNGVQGMYTHRAVVHQVADCCHLAALCLACGTHAGCEGGILSVARHCSIHFERCKCKSVEARGQSTRQSYMARSCYLARPQWLRWSCSVVQAR